MPISSAKLLGTTRVTCTPVLSAADDGRFVIVYKGAVVARDNGTQL